jgi:hypothetical protein
VRRSAKLAFEVAQRVQWALICNDERECPEFDRPEPPGYITRQAAKLIEADRIEAQLEVLRELFRGETDGQGMWYTANRMRERMGFASIDELLESAKSGGG